MKRFVNTLFFMFVSVTMMGQNSFIVADKNGNSQLVQSLIFKQEQYGDRVSSGIRFLWKSDGTANGNIKDLLFIARSQHQLSTASSNEITRVLEELSDTDQADAEALAVTLDKNVNVEESSPSDDGRSLFVQFKDDDVCTVYPMKQLYDPFEDETDDNSSYAKYYAQKSRKAAPNYRETGSRGKVAVFNYFSNQYTRETQNRMLEYMMQDLNNHNYGVEYYPYEKMTLDNLLAVYKSSENYTAVVIISHGFSKNNVSYFVTGEEFDENKIKDSRYNPFWESDLPESDKVPFSIRFWNEGTDALTLDDKYVFALKVKNFEMPTGVILYMGSCDAYPNGNNKRNTCVGWSGTQSTAQAHVTLLFYNLMRGKTLKDALDDPWYETSYPFDEAGQQLDTWKFDVMTNAKMECQYKGVYDINPPTLTPTVEYYFRGAKWLETGMFSGPIFLSDKAFRLNLEMDDIASTGAYPDIIYVKATPLRSDASPTIYSVKKIKDQPKYKPLKISMPENGIYVITAAVDEEFSKEILFRQPVVFVKAKPFKENGMDWDEPVLSCPDDGHPHMIDLGLPSGTLWACCNVGADEPEDCGDYYAWGETVKKDAYNEDNYLGGKGDLFYIGDDIAGTEYDVAHVKWGESWVMPSHEQIIELMDNCSSEWTTQNGFFNRHFIGDILHYRFWD